MSKNNNINTVQLTEADGQILLFLSEANAKQLFGRTSHKDCDLVRASVMPKLVKRAAECKKRMVEQGLILFPTGEYDSTEYKELGGKVILALYLNSLRVFASSLYLNAYRDLKAQKRSGAPGTVTQSLFCEDSGDSTEWTMRPEAEEALACSHDCGSANELIQLILDETEGDEELRALLHHKLQESTPAEIMEEEGWTESHLRTVRKHWDEMAKEFEKKLQ